MTAELGVDESTVPSPVNVTEVTVPPAAAVVPTVYQLVRLEASNVEDLPAPIATEALASPVIDRPARSAG